MKIILKGWHSHEGTWFPAGTRLEVTDGERKEMDRQGIAYAAIAEKPAEKAVSEKPAEKEMPAAQPEAPAPAPRTRRKK